jgi:hypothetical protein
MPWIYVQRSGHLLRPDGSHAGMGYSGRLTYRDNPSAQDLPNFGPIQAGFYTIGWPYNDRKHNKEFVMDLTPLSPISRSGFQIHGDKRGDPGFASEGCIILGPTVRAEIAVSGDRVLEVRKY